MDEKGERLKELMRKSRSLSEYNDRAAEYQRHRLDVKNSENGEMQRRKLMTQEERSRGAIEGIARDMKSHHEALAKEGRTQGEKTYDECHREAVRIAQEVERKR